MFEVHAPGKKIKDICQKLGSPYEIKVIDGENVIYKNLSNTYDFEISGLDNQKKSFNAKIYIWQLKPDMHIVETISRIKSLDELKAKLKSITTKYLDLIKLS